MRKISNSLFSILFIVLVIGSYVIVAQSVITGDWRTESYNDRRDKEKLGNDAKIHLSLERKTERGRRNQTGSSIAYTDLRGLTREQAQNGKANFRLVREAGIIDFEGSFTNGIGAGTFRFTPDSGYVNAMKVRGFDFEKSSEKYNDSGESRLLSATMIDVTIALADDLRSADLGSLDVEDLFKAAIFKVDSKFINEMKASGFPNLDIEDLVKARIFKIDADYVRQVHQMGFAKNDFENMVKYRIFKVTPEFLGELRDAGLTRLSSEDVVKFRIFKIDADFIRQARLADPNVTVEEMVQMKIGVRRVKVSR